MYDAARNDAGAGRRAAHFDVLDQDFAICAASHIGARGRQQQCGAKARRALFIITPILARHVQTSARHSVSCAGQPPLACPAHLRERCMPTPTSFPPPVCGSPDIEPPPSSEPPPLDPPPTACCQRPRRSARTGARARDARASADVPLSRACGGGAAVPGSTWRLPVCPCAPVG